MPQSLSFTTLIATTVLALAASLMVPVYAQNPVLVTQSAGSLESSLGSSEVSAEFGASGKWIATGDGSGTLLLFDIESGRIAQNIPTRMAFTELLPHPSKDLLVISGHQSRYDYSGGQVIALYDVTTGKELWRKTTSSNCSGLHFNADGSTLTAVCSESKTHKPKNNVMHWDSATGAESSGIALPDGTASPISDGDGRWIPYINVSIFSNPFKKGPSRDQAINQMYNRFNGFLVDSETGQTVGTFPGMIAALSSQAHTVMVNTSDGLKLLQIPGNKSLGTFARPRTGSLTSYSDVRASRDGTKYILTTSSKMSFVDAVTGAIQELGSIQIPASATAAFARDNDQVALAEGPTVTLLRLSKPDERRRLGNASALLAPNLATLLPDDTIKALSTPNSDADPRKKKPALHRRDGKAKNQEEPNPAPIQPVIEDAAQKKATETYMANVMQYTSQFGAASFFPPLPVFIDKGRLLVLLAAGGDWNVWDVATGNRLPYRRKFTFPQQDASDGEAFQFMLEDIRKIEKDFSLPPGDLSRPIVVQNRSPKARLAEMNAATSRKAKDPVRRVACSAQGQDVVAEIAWNYKSLDSATLHRADGSSVDLLAKGIDVSTFKPSTSRLALSEVLGSNDKGLCTLSPDTRRIVLEVVRKGHKEKKLPYKAGIFSIGVAGTFSDSLVVYDTDTGQRISELEREVPDEPFDISPGELVFSPDGTRLIAGGKEKVELAGERERTIKVWDPRTGKLIQALKGDNAGIAGFSADSRQFFSLLNPLAIDGSGIGIRVWDAASAKPLYDLPDIGASMEFLATTNTLLLGPSSANGLGIWNRQTGERLGTMQPLQEGEWLVTTTAGLFDGSPRGWQQVAWRDNVNSLTTQPGEIFFNEFYHPGLLAELLEGKVPTPPRTLAQVDRRQPSITLTSTATTTDARNMPLHLTVAEAPSSPGGLPAGGVRDVRLFRNGTMIKSWRGDLKLQNGKLEFDANVTIVAGDNKFVAYAFNRDNVKSPDAPLTIKGTSDPRPAKTYILSVGVDRYANPEFDLRYAVPDADRLAEVLAQSQRAVTPNQQVVKVVLHDDEATKANVILALDLLGGRHHGPLTPKTPRQLSGLATVNPEDTVIVYFAGHGLAWHDHFYLIPHDLGYTGPRKDLRGSLEQILHSSISELELERGFEPMDAAHLLLIIDACNSGKALDSEEQRRGPMNSHGLAQLAYEKGMYVLTAAQAYQAALESSRLGHGYLTYALAEEGLTTRVADTRPADGLISAEELFEYASKRVPQLQIEALQTATQTGRQLIFESDALQPSGDTARLQTPRLYYRRDLSGPVAILAKPN